MSYRQWVNVTHVRHCISAAIDIHPERVGARKSEWRLERIQNSSPNRAQRSLVVPSRRDLLRGLAGLGLALGSSWLPGPVEAGKKRKTKNKKRKNRIPTSPQPPAGPLCTESGEPCSVPGTDCQERFCPRAPLTISATWQSAVNHDTWLFVPPQDGATGPRPQIDYDCNQTNSPCAAQYPFACVSNDAKGPGDEVTTIFELLPGSYEYWIASDPAPAGELTIALTDRNGRLVRIWSNPTVTSALNGFWHVFDLDGATGRVSSVDAPPAPFPSTVSPMCALSEASEHHERRGQAERALGPAPLTWFPRISWAPLGALRKSANQKAIPALLSRRPSRISSK